MTEQNNDIRNTFGGIAEQYHQLRRRIEKIERSPADLRNAAIDGGRGLTIKSDAETIRFGDNGVEHLEGPAPEQPEAPFVDLGGESVKVQLSGLDAYGYPAQRNFKQAHIHVSQQESFDPSRSTFAGHVSQADGSITHRLPGGEWHVGVVWENMSGALSPMSDTTLADVEPLVDTGDIQDALDEAQGRLDTYRDEVAAPRFQALEVGLEANTTNLGDARERLSAAESTLSPLPGRIETAEQDVEAAKEAAVEAGAAAVEANNRAMTRLANGNFENGLDYWAHSGVTLSSTAHSGQQAALLGASGWLRPESSFPVVPDQIWELSLYHQHDVSVEFQAVDGGTRTTLETFHLDGDSGWADSGTLRVTIPADVDMLSFTVTGDNALVDDVTLRDVTDVVRLEEAANANRQKAEQAIAEYELLKLAVDGEGGLRDRLDTAETALEDKADETDLSELDDMLRGTEDMPDQVANRLFGKLGVFERIQGKEGLIGGVNLADGAVTAEKITASRELITRLFAAEWAYVANKLVVDGELIAANATVINAAMRSLSVAERADFVTAFADELFADEFTARSAVLARAIVAAPNLIPGVTQLKSGNNGFWPSPFGVNTGDPSVWLRNTVTARSAHAFDLVAGEKYHFSVDVRASVVNTRFYIGLVDDETGSEESGYLISGGQPGTGWTHFEATREITVTKKYRLIFFANHSSGATNTNYQWFRNISLRSKLDGRLLVDGTVTTRHLEVTETMVGKFAELLHLVVDRIDVNSLWADQTWQAAGHFGSEEADQSTLVDGTGLRITKHDHENGTSTDIVRLGGEGIGLVFTDAETDEVTGALSPEGDASLRDVSADTLSLHGTQLLPPDTPVEVHNNNLWDAHPKGLVCFHERDMAGVNVNHTDYGFMEVNYSVKADRIYRVSTNQWLMDNSNTHYGRFRYTLGDGTESPTTSSPQLGNTWLINTSTTGNVQVHGDHTFTPDQDGIIRILLCVNRPGSTAGLSFNTGSSFATAQLKLEDLGPARPFTGMNRNAGSGGAGTFPDPQPIGGAITTEWHAQWYQNYSHNGTVQRTTHESNWKHNPGGEGGYGSGGPTQGLPTSMPQSEGRWSSLMGFPTAGVSTDDGEVGKSLLQALTGKNIHSIILELRGGGSFHHSGRTRFNLLAHPTSTAPGQHPSGGHNIVIDHWIRTGETIRLNVPVDQFGTMLKTGDFQTLGIRTGSNLNTYAGWLDWWTTRPKFIINYS